MTTSDDDLLEREFERNGEERIRLELHNGNLTGKVAILASRWLGARAERAEARREASMRAQTEIARSTKNAAWVAALVGVVAVLVSATTVLVMLR